MEIRLETFGNAILQFSQDGRPVLATDPWLAGTCYFGSWGLERPPTEEQIRRVQASPFVWISHGHPDHLHPASLELLSKERTRILLPDHYHDEIRAGLAARGFSVTVLPFKRWVPLTGGIRVLSLGNENQDGILVVQAGSALVIDLNDSPLCGEGGFLRRLVARHPNDRTYLAALCSVDADMFNFVDEHGRSLAGDPEARKPGAVWNVARTAARLGVRNFCCSSSQHVYVRRDSVWANPYRITAADMRRHWNRPEVRLIDPYVTIDLERGDVRPAGGSTVYRGWASSTADDWTSRLNEEEWSRVGRFARSFETIRRRIDFLAFTVGGETRRFDLDPARPGGERGIEFQVPRAPLLETVEYGYFDDLLIGNFMRTRLIGVRLYPDFSYQVGKLGGNAKVFTAAGRRRFRWAYLRKSPRAFLTARCENALRFRIQPWAREAAARIGVKPLAKVLYRRYLRGEPV